MILVEISYKSHGLQRGLATVSSLSLDPLHWRNLPGQLRIRALFNRSWKPICQKYQMTLIDLF